LKRKRKAVKVPVEFEAAHRIAFLEGAEEGTSHGTPEIARCLDNPQRLNLRIRSVIATPAVLNAY
jgi:hypothetical protein